MNDTMIGIITSNSKRKLISLMVEQKSRWEDGDTKGSIETKIVLSRNINALEVKHHQMQEARSFYILPSGTCRFLSMERDLLS